MLDGRAAIAQRAPGTRVGRSRRGWDARLALAFARRGDRSRARSRASHHGPLVVQKALHPEGPGVCQAIVVHPPGGIAGGDRLALVIDVGADAHAQLTTPGAAKWYRSTGAAARQTFEARVGAGGTLEWLPQEAIVFDGARVETATVVDARTATRRSSAGISSALAARRRASASGSGHYRQRFELVRDGALVWAERTMIDGGADVTTSPVGLNGCPMFGTFVVAAPVIADAMLAACRHLAPGDADAIEGAVTRLPGVLVARCRGRPRRRRGGGSRRCGRVVRPAVCGRVAVPPRIWNT